MGTHKRTAKHSQRGCYGRRGSGGASASCRWKSHPWECGLSKWRARMQKMSQSLRPSDSQRKVYERRGTRSEVGVRTMCPGLSLRASFTLTAVTVLALLCNKQRLAGFDWIIGRENAFGVACEGHSLLWLRMCDWSVAANPRPSVTTHRRAW
jgi:hypothetical protein